MQNNIHTSYPINKPCLQIADPLRFRLITISKHFADSVSAPYSYSVTQVLTDWPCCISPVCKTMSLIIIITIITIIIIIIIIGLAASLSSARRP